jgi:hypothetical protein
MAHDSGDREVRGVQEFLAESKTLQGKLPLWAPTPHRHRELSATWAIVDSLGVERAELRFRCLSASRQFPSVSVIFRHQPIWRVDLVPLDECKWNPHWAQDFGVPARICGSHCHGWPDNEAHILKIYPEWELPCRRPLPAQVRRLPQALLWIGEQIGVTLTKGQHGFDVPPQSDLFSGGR